MQSKISLVSSDFTLTYIVSRAKLKEKQKQTKLLLIGEVSYDLYDW